MVSLTKGQKVSLAKEAPDMNVMYVGLGWDVNEKKGFFSSGSDFDLDAFAVICRGGRFTKKKDLVYFANLTGVGGAVKHMGDNLTGEGEGDDERIMIDLRDLPSEIDKIVIGVNIYKGTSRRQDFSQVSNAFVRICDASNENEVLKYDLTGDFSGLTSMIFGELYRHKGEWKFNPIGEGVKEDSIEKIAATYA